MDFLLPLTQRTMSQCPSGFLTNERFSNQREAGMSNSRLVALLAGLVLVLSGCLYGCATMVVPGRGNVDQSVLSSVKTVFVMLFENTNWASITPSVAPYIRTTVVPMGAHATQYFNPPGNHPSEPNYIWFEAG